MGVSAQARVRTALRVLLYGVSLSLALRLAPTPLMAQGAGGIRGVVVGHDGTSIQGATVAVTATSLGVSVGSVTDRDGAFRIAPLPPGRDYTVRVSFPGMATVVISEAEVTPGRVTALSVTLVPETAVQEKVRIVASPNVVDPDTTTTQSAFSAEFIGSLPILGRNYQDVVSLAPGVTDVNGDGNPNIHGARDTDVMTLVDGVSTVDPLTGKAGQQLNIESIQEIEVKTSGASAEYGRAQGGFVQIVTKSGGNEFEGSFKFLWRGRALDGDGAGIDDPRLHGGTGELGLRDLNFNDFLPFLSLSGPIKRDHAWYYVTAEYIQIEEPVNALTQAFVRTTKEKRLFGKVSWDMTPSQKLMFAVTLDPQTYDNLGLDSLTALESGWTEQAGGTNLTLKETAIISPNVFLETTLQDFRSNPQVIPTTGPDTNGDGTLFIDRNKNGVQEANERDPGEDLDQDGAWDVFEADVNENHRFDASEDLDHDGRRTPSGPRGGCEGVTREDRDCDGHLDAVNEDKNHNNSLDYGEDLDGDFRLDGGTLPDGTPWTSEDHNGNRNLDDRPYPKPTDVLPTVCDGFLCTDDGPPNYPYDRFVPLLRDRDWHKDYKSGRINGPYFVDYDRQTSRATLREDLTVFVPDWHGQHDLKMGGAAERESFSQIAKTRPAMFTSGTLFSTQISALMPAQSQTPGEASSTNFGMYVSDTYKPMPNLTVGLGLRFDRETTEAPGYTPVDPATERALYDRLRELSGGEIGQNDEVTGNADGIDSQGIVYDPIFQMAPFEGNPTSNPVVTELGQLVTIAPSRLTQHHTSATLVARGLQALFPAVLKCENPDLPSSCSVDRDALRASGASTFQEEQTFRLTNNNLAPRLSVSWDPWADSKTKVFLNWGRYYDKLFLQTVVLEQGPDFMARYYTYDADGINSVGIPDANIGTVISKAPPSAYQVDRNLATPFSDELTCGFERELAPEIALRVTYINRKFRQQLQDRDINHYLKYDESGRPLDEIGTVLVADGRGSPIISRIGDNHPDLYVRNFFFNQILKVGNYNDARYTGFEVQVTKRLHRRWQMNASYTYSRAVGAAEEFLSSLGDDPSTVQDEFGYLDYDQRHVVKLNAVTYLPHDWQLGWVAQWASGLPYSVINEFQSLDNFDYTQQRTMYGYVPEKGDASGRIELIPVRRNSERNDPTMTINVRAQKALVIGHMASKLFLTVDNLLNSDYMRILSYDPSGQRTYAISSETAFGRRWEVGWQIDF